MEKMSEMESELRLLRDSRNFLAEVCDTTVSQTVRDNYQTIDARWRQLQFALEDCSANQFESGVDELNRWCDLVSADLLGNAAATHDDICKQLEFLQVQYCFCDCYSSVTQM